MFENISFYSALILLLLPLLAIAIHYFAYQLGYRKGQIQADTQWQEKVPEIRQDARNRSRATLGGKFSENLAPFLPDFHFKATECRFLGNPVDFIVFKGSDEKNISEIIFVEIKSGQSRLNTQEKNLRAAIEAGRVSYVEYRVPDEITN